MKTSQRIQAVEFKHSAKLKSLGIPTPRADKDANPIRLPDPRYRTPDAQLMGDPPIGRSALDERVKA